MYEEKLKQLDLFNCEDMCISQSPLASYRGIIEKAEPD